jgi:hypothetical protein
MYGSTNFNDYSEFQSGPVAAGWLPLPTLPPITDLSNAALKTREYQPPEVIISIHRQFAFRWCRWKEISGGFHWPHEMAIILLSASGKALGQ